MQTSDVEFWLGQLLRAAYLVHVAVGWCTECWAVSEEEKSSSIHM
jgi:hypothetical protein